MFFKLLNVVLGSLTELQRYNFFFDWQIFFITFAFFALVIGRLNVSLSLLRYRWAWTQWRWWCGRAVRAEGMVVVSLKILCFCLYIHYFLYICSAKKKKALCYNFIITKLLRYEENVSFFVCFANVLVGISAAWLWYVCQWCLAHSSAPRR